MNATVLIADDHGFTLEGMQRAVGETDGLCVVGVASCGIEAIGLARRLEPDLAVLDFQMPDATGLEVVAEIARWSPGTRCAIVTGVTRPAVLTQIARAGVPGLFLKGASPQEICAGLVRVAQGATVLPEGLDMAASGPELSPREREVLQGIARGLTNAGIAEDLSISPKTVESHRASLMRKLGVHSTAALLARAVRDDLVSF